MPKKQKKQVKRVTLRDVAEQAGVSTTIVSKIINDKETGFPVSEQTRQKVNQAVIDLRYRPNAYARALSSGHGDNLAIIGRHANLSPFYAPLFYAISDRCLEKNLNLVSWFIPEELEQVSDLKLFREMNIEGLILINDVEPELLKVIDDRGLPKICVNSNIEDTNDCVIVDDFAGAYEATRYLIEFGHTDLALFLNDSPHPSVKKREAGFRAAMRESNLVDDRIYVLEETEESLTFPVGNELKNKTMPTGLVFYSDTLMLRGLTWCYYQGYRIPEDISVLCFNDTYIPENTFPGITSVRIPIEEMGKTVVDMLIRKIESRSPQPTINMVPQLVIRNSCGPFSGEKFNSGKRRK